MPHLRDSFIVAKVGRKTSTMRIALQLAAALLLTTAAATSAQVSNPDKLVSPPPTRTPHQRPQPTDDLQWLWPFTKPAPIGRADDLRVNGRFQSLLTREFKQPQAMWGSDPNHPPALATIVPLFITKYGAVSSSSNRYITIDGCVPSFCSAAGLLWIDTQGHDPLIVFVATNWITASAAANEPGSNRNIDPSSLPFALKTSIADWSARLAAAHRLVPHVTRALLVEPSGAPFALDPELAGANTLAPQPDTVTPQPTDN
jgi:hypothetical protein